MKVLAAITYVMVVAFLGSMTEVNAKYTSHHHVASNNKLIRRKEPVGSNPCTWGPSYWCANEDHMMECGLTKEECAKHMEAISS
jgi:hypothetical protein